MLFRSRTIRVWDARSGDTVAGPFQGHTDWVRSVGFSQDGTRIASGSDDRTIRVWDARSGDTVAGPFQGHTNLVTSVRFSQDGTRIVSGSADCTIRVWDAHSGDTVVGPFRGHTDWVTSVGFSQDGTRIASGSHDYTIRALEACNNDPIPESISINAPAFRHIPNIFTNMDRFVLNRHGWITANDHPFFWISSDFCLYLPFPTHNTLVIGPRGNVLIDYCSHLNIGETWPACFSP